MTQSLQNTICVIGGSNSIKAEGWTTELAKSLPNGATVLNESVGAVHGIMGWYRLSALKQLKPGDVVLWEYALNDQNYIDHRGSDPALLLRFCEHVIRLCHIRGLRLIPMIFATRTVAALPEMTRYRRDLRLLFGHYKLDYLDVSEEILKKLDRPRVPKFIYSDEMHYKGDSFVVRFIANRVLELIRFGAGAVADDAPLFSTGLIEGQIVTTFDKGRMEKFSNSRISIDCWTPQPDGTPVSIQVESGPFRLVGVVMLCTPFGAPPVMVGACWACSE